MAIILVEHDTSEPALYGAVAATVARERGAKFAHLPAVFDTQRQVDAVQHVAAIGALVPSGLVWPERLLGLDVDREATLEHLLSQGRSGDLVVPWHRSVAADWRAAHHLLKEAHARRIVVERIAVAEENGAFRICGVSLRSQEPRIWRRDRFGRLSSSESDEPKQLNPPLRIVIVGAETDHRHVYPAALAALGDAADAEGIDVGVRFVPPLGLRNQDVDPVLTDIDGLLLPGGSDMENVPGQILLASGALRRQTPTIGLCLGMQTMTTAVAQQILGSEIANLAEVDPSAVVKTFKPLSEDTTLPKHRLGEKKLVLARGSRLQNILGTETSIRCNHRFRLNSELHPLLSRAGLAISAHDISGQIADAIELAGHTFYFAMQGHPELSSRLGKPHPLIRAFVQACRRHSNGAAQSKLNSASKVARRRPVVTGGKVERTCD